MSPKRLDRVAPPRSRANGTSGSAPARPQKAGTNCPRIRQEAPGGHSSSCERTRGLQRTARTTGSAATSRPETFAGRALEQWQIKVSGAGRIWYLPDDSKHTVWVVYASPAHPKQTE